MMPKQAGGEQADGEQERSYECQQIASYQTKNANHWLVGKIMLYVLIEPRTKLPKLPKLLSAIIARPPGFSIHKNRLVTTLCLSSAVPIVGMFAEFLNCS